MSLHAIDHMDSSREILKSEAGSLKPEMETSEVFCSTSQQRSLSANFKFFE